MLKKAVLIVLAAMLAVFGASISYAQPAIDGLQAGIVSQSFINPGALGDSLLYGYYNVRGNLNLFNVVNTTDTDGAKVRVIFRNAKDSRECLDFSVCLSKGDVWTAFLVDNGTTAVICPLDTDTITAPTIPSTCQEFKYEGSGGLTGVTADDCKEGYFEVIGMQSIAGFDHNACPSGSGCIIGSETECRDFTCANLEAGDVDNVLMGNNAIVDLTTLATYSYNASAVGDTTLGCLDLPSGRELSIPFAMDNGCGEADFIFMKENIISPYDIIASLGGETEVITTFPTRLECHTLTTNPTTCDTMFGANCCVPISVAVWDDKENRVQISEFSPAQELCLPHEVNVVKIGGSAIWNSTVAVGVSTGTFDLGWVNIDLFANVAAHTATSGGVTLNGLPAIGYTTQSFFDGIASYLTPVAYRTTP